MAKDGLVELNRLGAKQINAAAGAAETGRRQLQVVLNAVLASHGVDIEDDRYAWDVLAGKGGVLFARRRAADEPAPPADLLTQNEPRPLMSKSG